MGRQGWWPNLPFGLKMSLRAVSLPAETNPYKASLPYTDGG
jgi:hypothetical protein